MKIGKYKFDSKEQAESKIQGLGVETDEDGNEYPTHNHAIVHLGHIVLEQGEYDEEGNEIVAPVLSVKWHVDTLWDISDSVDENGDVVLADHPYGWKSYAVSDIDGNGIHSFYGLNYETLKFEN